MASFLLLLFFVLFLWNGATATADVLSDDIIAGYEDAFSKYQVAFGKHYSTKEEYDLRLRAYAVCFLFFSFLFGCLVIDVDLSCDRCQWRR